MESKLNCSSVSLTPLALSLAQKPDAGLWQVFSHLVQPHSLQTPNIAGSHPPSCLLSQLPLSHHLSAVRENLGPGPSFSAPFLHLNGNQGPTHLPTHLLPCEVEQILSSVDLCFSLPWKIVRIQQDDTVIGVFP